MKKKICLSLGTEICFKHPGDSEETVTGSWEKTAFGKFGRLGRKRGLEKHPQRWRYTTQLKKKKSGSNSLLQKLRYNMLTCPWSSSSSGTFLGGALHEADWSAELRGTIGTSLQVFELALAGLQANIFSICISL